MRWIAVGIASWLTFLFLEIVEWVRLVYMVQLGPGTAFGGTYLALTGAHWVAVCACVCWMTYVANDTRRRDVVAVAMYSHFLNLLWIVLVFTLYFTNADAGGDMNWHFAIAAQCVMCYRTAAAQQAERSRVLNSGIVILLMPPVLVLAGILILAFRKSETAAVRI